jgi:uncharacterized protein YjiS (DUF1127 family)
MQSGLAGGSIALQVQHRYLTVIGKREALFTATSERNTAMATYETSRAAPFGAITLFRMVQSVSSAASALQAWNAGRITRKALSKLSNRELDDIGLCRSDIDLIGR